MFSAQEYLNQIRQIDEQMRIIQSQIHNIVELTGINYEREPGGQPSSDSPVERLAMRRLELLERYDAKKEQLLKKKYEITDTIMTLRGRYQQEILFRRYVELKPWRKVARELNLSESQTYAVHKEALEEISKKIEKIGVNRSY